MKGGKLLKRQTSLEEEKSYLHRKLSGLVLLISVPRKYNIFSNSTWNKEYGARQAKEKLGLLSHLH